MAYLDEDATDWLMSPPRRNPDDVGFDDLEEDSSDEEEDEEDDDLEEEDDEDDDDEDDDDDNSNDDDYNNDDTDCDDNSINEDNSGDFLRQYNNFYNAEFDDENDTTENERRKRKFKMTVKLNNIRDPYVSIRNRSLKWKFIRGDKHDDEKCTFRIYSCTTQTFDSAFILLSEIFANKSMNDLPLNDLWLQLVKISCLMTYTKRLKIIHLLIKIIEHVLQSPTETYSINYLNLFALKPLRSLLCSLASYKEGSDTDSLRALYELFFYAEKLVFKWSICNEYNARLKSKNSLIKSVVDYAMKISIIENEILNKNSSTLSTQPENENTDEKTLLKEENDGNNSETTDSISSPSL